METRRYSNVNAHLEAMILETKSHPTSPQTPDWLDKKKTLFFSSVPYFTLHCAYNDPLVADLHLYQYDEHLL